MKKTKSKKKQKEAQASIDDGYWFVGLISNFVLSFACDLQPDCSEGSGKNNAREMDQEYVRPIPFLHNDDETLTKCLPIRLPKPERNFEKDTRDEQFLWEVLDELNECRCNPRRYAEIKLKPLLKQYDGLNLTPLERDETLPSTWISSDHTPRKSFQPPPNTTHEGRAALEEAIQVLMDTAPARAIEREAGLDRAAQEHAADLAQRPSGASLGHVGTDGSKPADRLSRHGQWYEAAAEMLTFREATARGVVASLIVCDGAKARNERAALLNDDLRVAGLSVAPHKTLECIVVITAAVGYGPKPLDHPARVVSLESSTKSALSIGDDFFGVVDDKRQEDTSDQGPATSPNSMILGKVKKQRELGAAFEAVLYSIPLPHVHERVLAALSDGAEKVYLDYSPPDGASLGRVLVSITWPDRAHATRFSAQWS